MYNGRFEIKILQCSGRDFKQKIKENEKNIKTTALHFYILCCDIHHCTHCYYNEDCLQVFCDKTFAIVYLSNEYTIHTGLNQNPLRIR